MTSKNKNLQSLTVINHNLNTSELQASFVKSSEQLMELMVSQGRDNLAAVDEVKQALYELGSAEQSSYWKTNGRLIQPLQQLLADTRSGGHVASLLQKLQQKVKALQPPQKRLSWKDRFLLLFSVRESAIEMWMENYPERKQEVSELVGQLSSAKKQLQRDNRILSEDRSILANEVKKLESMFDFLTMLEQQTQAKIEKNHSSDLQLLKDEFLPVLQKRWIEMQQQLLIARQSVMTVELLMDQNRSLIQGIDQSIRTTTSAMEVAAGVAMVNHRNKDLAKVSAMQLDVEKLKQAQQLIDQTINDIQRLGEESATAVESIKARQSDN